MLTELLAAPLWALVGFGLALIIWRRNRFRASLFGLSLSMTLTLIWAFFFGTLNPIRGTYIPGDLSYRREIGLALFFSVYISYLIAYILVRKGNMTLHRASSWFMNASKITLLISLISVAYYPALTAIYAVLYIIIGVWTLKNQGEMILNMTGAEKFELGWIRGFLRKYGVEVEETYLVRNCFTALLTGRRFFIGEKLLDFEPDEIKAMTLEVAYIEKRGVPLRHIILGLLVFLASAMIVSQVEEDLTKLGAAVFLWFLSWGIDMAYITKVRAETDRFVAKELGKDVLERTLKKAVALARADKKRDEVMVMSNVEKRMKKV
ncbi:hypothetical protein E3E26_10650 [Thermococcus sp. LS1]|uniref:hypothetical protein n=1 Tax=Thermococcus sp. LS1 TaxID=1638259 RepID=UPI0014397110|nr:hypothetical protein [Thermococcus sp. LS1]NJE00229.1 hypothetical protein [Thermococcus sp. LS1]